MKTQTPAPRKMLSCSESFKTTSHSGCGESRNSHRATLAGRLRCPSDGNTLCIPTTTACGACWPSSRSSWSAAPGTFSKKTPPKRTLQPQPRPPPLYPRPEPHLCGLLYPLFIMYPSSTESLPPPADALSTQTARAQRCRLRILKLVCCWRVQCMSCPRSFWVTAL